MRSDQTSAGVRWARFIGLLAGVVFALASGPLRAQTGSDRVVIEASLGVLDQLNSGRAEAVHQAMGPNLQAQIPEADLIAQWDQVRSTLGPAKSGGVARVTWYDDPEDPGGAGRLAAADLGLRYPSDHIACGYLLWAVDADGQVGPIRRLELTWLPPEMVALPRDAFLDAFQSTPCKSLPNNLLEPSE